MRLRHIARTLLGPMYPALAALINAPRTREWQARLVAPLDAIKLWRTGGGR